jgi:hypothetical protein
MDVAQVAAHYERQIVPTWRVRDRFVDGDRIALTRFEAADTTGDPTIGLLVVSSLGATNSLFVELRNIRRVTKTIPPPAVTPGTVHTGIRLPGKDDPQPMAKGNILLADEIKKVMQLRALTAQNEDSYILQADTPAGFPRDLWPPDAHADVAAISKTITTVVAVAPRLTAGALPKFLLGFPDRGWTHLSPGPRGFVVRTASIGLCRGTQIAELDVVPRSVGGFLVRTKITAGPCAAARVPPAMFSDVALPLVWWTTPTGSSGISGGGGLNLFHSQIRTEATQLTPVLISDFSKQMVDEGWNPEGRIDAGTLALSRFNGASSRGEPMTAFLGVLTMPGSTTMDAWIEVIRHQMLQ